MDATKDLILNAARLLFLRDGYAGTSTEAVSEKAGLNKSLIHYYFNTKESLYKTTLKTVTEEEIIPAMESLSMKDSIEDRLKILQAFREVLSKKYPRLPLVLMDEKEPGHEVKIQAFQDYSYTMKRFERHIAERVFNTTFKESDAGFLLVTLLSVSLFPYLFKDMLKVALDMNNEEYLAMLDQYFYKFLGM